MADLRLPRLNKAVISGRIANDLELKFTPKGTPVIQFTLATDRAYKDDSDQWQTITSWIDCTAWDWLAEKISKDLHKGSAVIVEGRIETHNWTDQNNNNRKSTKVNADMVHFLEWKPREDGASQPSSEAPLPPEEMASKRNTTNDDVPF